MKQKKILVTISLLVILVLFGLVLLFIYIQKTSLLNSTSLIGDNGSEYQDIVENTTCTRFKFPQDPFSICYPTGFEYSIEQLADGKQKITFSNNEIGLIVTTKQQGIGLEDDQYEIQESPVINNAGEQFIFNGKEVKKTRIYYTNLQKLTYIVTFQYSGGANASLLVSYMLSSPQLETVENIKLLDSIVSTLVSE